MPLSQELLECLYSTGYLSADLWVFMRHNGAVKVYGDGISAVGIHISIIASNADKDTQFSRHNLSWLYSDLAGQTHWRIHRIPPTDKRVARRGKV